MSSITGFLKVVGNDHDLLILLENGHRHRHRLPAVVLSARIVIAENADAER
jgi:hypothetical protein